MASHSIKSLGSVITLMGQGAELWKQGKRAFIVLPSSRSIRVDGRVAFNLFNRRPDLIKKIASYASGDLYGLVQEPGTGRGDPGRP